MCRLIESIKIQNRQVQNPEGHTRRFNQSRRQLFGLTEELDLRQIVQIPEHLTNEVYKCRILYANWVESIDFQPYTPKKVHYLQLVEANEVDYAYKYENRLVFDRLLENKGQADDILIVKNGFITDTSFSNIAFFDGDRWVTPDTFLLNGTQRQRLIAQGVLAEMKIKPSDLQHFSKAKLINAMLDFETTPTVSVLFDGISEKRVVID